MTSAFLLLICAQARADFHKNPWLQDVTPSSIMVVWEADDIENPAPEVWVGLTADYELTQVTATHAEVNGYSVYSARIDGLEPNTRYQCQVVSGNALSPAASFKTAPEAGSSSYRFYVTGDTRSQIEQWQEVANLIWADAQEYPEHHQTFVLITGDVVADGSIYTDWDQFWPPADDLVAHLPVYVAFGNHEDKNTMASDAFLYGYFETPAARSGSDDEKWFSFDYGNSHFSLISIYDDGGYSSGAQYDWLAADLPAADSNAITDWLFFSMHFLPWSLGTHGEADASELRSVIHPLLRNSGLTVAFGGHNHLYCRYEPVEEVSYITVGGGGAPLHTGVYTPWTGASLATEAAVYHFGIMDIEGDIAAFRAIDVDGHRIDWITFGGTPSNRPPLADAGPNQEVAVSDTIQLDASASVDPEGRGLDYQWQQLHGVPVTLDNPSLADPRFSAVFGGRYLFELRVFDGTYWSAPDFVMIEATIAPVTISPVADTYIDASNPDSNFGSSSNLSINADPTLYHSYLRFDVSGVQGEVTNARLRLYCSDSGDAGEVRVSEADMWPETEPSWNEPLPEDGPIVGLLPSVAVGAWAEADVRDRQKKPRI